MYKTEYIRNGSPFRTGPLHRLSDLEEATAAWVHWYNTRRLMHPLGRIPPDGYEALYNAKHRDGKLADHTQPSVHKARDDSVELYVFSRPVRLPIEGWRNLTLVYEDEMSPHDPFQSVVDAARSGAEWAWARLVNDIDGTLRGYVRRQGSVDVDDIVGETWLHVARGLHRFTGNERAFRSWVFMIAHHRVIDERRSRRRKPVELTEQPVLDQAGPSTGSAESMVMERLDEEELQRILEMLSPAQREVLLLRFVAGFGIKEIAGIIGKKPGAVQALQRRAFRQLEKILR